MCTEAHLLSPVSRAESIEPVISNGDASSYIYGPNGHEAARRPSLGGAVEPPRSGSLRSSALLSMVPKASAASSQMRRDESFASDDSHDQKDDSKRGFDQVVPHQDTARAKASLHQRRRSTVECLMNLHGQDDDAMMNSGDDLDITRIELKPHEFWVRAFQGHDVTAAMRRLNQERMAYGGDEDKTLDSEMPLERTATMIHPGGTFRMVWNILVALCLVHDLVVIPLYVFDIPDSAVLITLEWCTQLFWNFDILLSMHTGYYYKGLLIMSARKVFRNYVRTWMALDVTLVSLDWIFVILEVSGIQITSVAQLSRTIRFLRFLRLVRILRWVKLRRMAEMFQELIQSQSAGMYWSLVFGIARLLILNHLVACAWFGLSRIQGEVNWVEAHGLTDKSSLHKYWTCLNWAFAQLGVGLSDITPRTTTETFFSVLIAFRSLITCTTLISRMTSLMTALIKTKEDEEREFRLLRSYLVYNEIPHSLGQKVTRFLQHQFNLRVQAKSADVHVPLLELLSHRLQGELQFARHQKSLYQLEFLDHLMHEKDLQIVHAMQDISMKALISVPVAAKDIIFLGGNLAGKSYLILTGEFAYYHEKGKVTLDNDAGWIAEMCLWTPWVYLGDLLAQDVSRIACLDSALFGQILGQCQPAQESAKEYARHFISGMRRKRYWTDLVADDLTEEAENSSFGTVTHLPTLNKDRAQKGSKCCPLFSRKRKVVHHESTK
ncbi:unnamed protein product [Durusdinium trenchii]|uniref:Cyclic nucleotide-binding domain-containing protein n=1 Tax=Durusdinium trenchii TaxID=1381693 RepID=A0ABP0QGZ6_9DINO